ncbi:MAG: methyl-accepting chemotaxis protein [Desulfobacteraceae bacterium]|nr:methyl-accepting chemotaxis protein [Desulfobacteraceae bacterium]
MTVRAKLMSLGLLSLLATSILFGVSWYSMSAKARLDSDLEILAVINLAMFKAIVREKEFFIDHDLENTRRAEEHFDTIRESIYLVKQEVFFDRDEVDSLSKTVENYRTTLFSLFDLESRVQEIHREIEQQVDKFNTGFMERNGSPGDPVNAGQSSPGVKAWEILEKQGVILVSRVVVSVNRDLMVNQDMMGFYKTTKAVFEILEKVKPVTDSLKSRLAAEGREDLHGDIDRFMETADFLPGQVRALIDLWPGRSKQLVNLDDSRKKMVGYLNLISKNARAQEKEQERMLFLVNLAVFGMVVLILLIGGSLTLTAVLDPIRKAALGLKNIAQGKGDLTQSLAVGADDEIGALATWFNAFIQKLRELVTRISDNVRVLGGASSDLLSISRQLEERASGMDRQAVTTVGLIQKTVGRFKAMGTSTAEVSDRIDSVAQSSATVCRKLDNSRTAVDSLSSAVTSLACAMEEIYATLNEVTVNASQGSAITSDAATKAEDTNAIVTVMGTSASEIGDVIELIQDIAFQTNLLALNASIEAAGAGEAGRGFAVVANEVKALSKQTAKASSDIRAKVKFMQTSTNTAIAAIQAIAGVVREVDGIMGSIAMAVGEQTKIVNDISKTISKTAGDSETVAENMEELVRFEEEVSRAVGEVAQASKAIARQLAKASDDSDQILKTMETLSLNVESTAQSSETTKRQAGDLSVIARNLEAVMAEFKI